MPIQKGAGIGRHGPHFVGQILQLDLRVIQPFLIGLGLGQGRLDLFVADDTAFFHVDQEHLARLQAPFPNDLFLWNVQHAHFRTHDHQIIVGYHVAGRAQAVAVQGGADLAAVGEGNGGGAVPRLHQGGVIFIEGTPVHIHEGVVVPGLGNHHHHGLRHGIAARHQQFKGVVVGGGIRSTVADQGPQFVQIRAQYGRSHGLAPRRHPVNVSAHRIDLAIMAEETEGLRQFPGRESIGGKPLMYQGQGGFRAAVLQIKVVI